MRLVVASNNAKKRREIEAILGSMGVELVPSDETVYVDVEEDGETFAENARKKAEAFAAANQLPALADDSGLCVDALNGAPGVYSARYAGVQGDDAANNAHSLKAMGRARDRRASFVCHLHLAWPDGRPGLVASGEVVGGILHEADGEQGFGYDPLFFSPELGKSFASASAEEKAGVSHRGRALRALAAKLQAVLAR